MATLNLVPYDIPGDASVIDGVLTPSTHPYPIKDALINVLFNQQGLRARALLERDDLARKILNAETDTIDLSAVEVTQLTVAFDVMEGFGRHDAELVRRVFGLTVEP